MRMKLFSIGLVAGFLTIGAWAPKAKACDVCSIYVASEAKSESEVGLYLGVSEQFTHFGTLQQDGHKVFNPVGQYLDSSTTQVFLGYNIWEGIGVQVNLPIITRHYKRPQEFLVEKGDVSGIGDLAALLNWQLSRSLGEDGHAKIKLHAGAKFPTGSASRIAEELNEHEEEMDPMEPMPPESGIHGHDLALGTGSYDAIFGADFSIVWKRLLLSGGIQYIARTRGSYDYRFADELTWNAGPGVFLIRSSEGTLALQAVASGERKGLDDLSGKPAEDTGIKSFFLGPSITVSLGKWFSMDASGEIPVLRDNTALQIVPDYRVHLGLTFNLPSFSS